MWLFSLLLAVFGLILFFSIVSRFKFKGKLVKRHKPKRKEEDFIYSTQNNTPSNFQQWILDYCKIKNPEKLEGKLKKAYLKDDWNLLDPSIYSKWSKYKWDI